MESRKGADGLIAPLAQVASAGVILALATAVALLLAGCGGDSGGESESTAGAEPARAAAKAPSSRSRASAKSKASGENEAAGNNSAGTNSSGAGGKQGPPIAAPKGAPEPGITPEQRETAKVASIALESPDTVPSSAGPATLPTPYTCDGKGSWPALRWQGVPAGTEELVLLMMGLQPVEGKVSFAWAVGGIDPSLEGIEAGRLPSGAVTGLNSFGRSGYSVCPPPGQGENYFFALYALPTKLHPRPNFDAPAVRELVQKYSRDVGILAVSYQRG